MDETLWAATLACAGGEASTTDPRDSLAKTLTPLVRAKRLDMPLVVGQLGLSLDGRIATPTGSSRGINGPAAMVHLHRLRALVDAVIVGAGTIRIDDPQLTVRNCVGPSPARVVIDPRGAVSTEANVWSAADGARRLVVGGADRLNGGVERLAPPDGEVTPEWLLKRLAQEGMRRVLIEGGARTISQFVAARAVDYLHLMVGPVIIGSGLNGFSLPEIGGLEDAIRPETEIHVFDQGDVLYACRMR